MVHYIVNTFLRQWIIMFPLLDFFYNNMITILYWDCVKNFLIFGKDLLFYFRSGVRFIINLNF